ncbi:MAG: type IV pilus modification PilV family protein [Acetobacteraceae bacterium]
MSRAPARGFTLVEVLVAMSILLAAAGSLVELLAVSARASRTAQRMARASALANARLEQLQGLAWGVRPDGRLFGDDTTDLSVQPWSAAGVGLGLSPPGVLDANTPGWVDFLDAQGRWLATGERAPPGTVYVRRWAITAPSEDPENTRLVQVIVLVAPEVSGAAPVERGRSIGARAIGVRVRTMG